MEGQAVGEVDVHAALGDFDAVWACLAPKEHARIVELLVERVAYYANEGTVAVSLRPAGIKRLAGDLAQQLVMANEFRASSGHCMWANVHTPDGTVGRLALERGGGWRGLSGEPPPVQGLAVVAEVLRLIIGDSGSGGGDSFA